MSTSRGPEPKFNESHRSKLEYMRTEGIQWDVVERMTGDGSSQTQIALILGCDQSWLSRKLRNLNGIPWSDMDASRRRKTDGRAI